MSEEKKAWGGPKDQLFLDKKSGYDLLDEQQVVSMTDYCEGYKAFLDEGQDRAGEAVDTPPSPWPRKQGFVPL